LKNINQAWAKLSLFLLLRRKFFKARAKYLQISWHGQSFLEIEAKNAQNESVTIVIDPFGEGYGIKIPKIKADIVLVSHDHQDHNNVKAIDGDFFLIDSPGEYEAKGAMVKGFFAFHDKKQGQERGRVIVFYLGIEGVKIGFLSDFGEEELSNEQIESLGEIDILFVPVGGVYTINGKEAAGVISQVEPKIAIPIHYKIDKLNISLDPLDNFLKSMGEEEAQREKKLKVNAKNLSGEETKIIVLEP
jgi:L-ascorbate metabolism protein UlaG (beta-lactamase superfamily)